MAYAQPDDAQDGLADLAATLQLVRGRQTPPSTNMPKRPATLLSLLVAVTLTLPLPARAQAARRCAVPRFRDTSALRRSLVIASDSRAALGPVHEVCGHRDLVIASAWVPGRDDSLDYGPRLVLARRLSGHRYRLIYFTRGLGDAELPGFHLYRVASRVLVLADLGSEGSWGLGAYELNQAGLQDLGLLAVGLPPSTPGDPARSAMRRARPRLGLHGWRVAFDTVIVENPGQESARLVRPRAGQPLWFQQNTPQWHRTP
jgi:hypothetical protein